MRAGHTHSMASALTVLLACALFVDDAKAQAYPSAPVKIVMSTGAGSGPDVIGRIAADHLSRLWGHQAIILNHPGATGAIAMRVAGNASPDGYTLLQALGSGFFALPEVQATFPFDLVRDFVPIGLVGEQPMVIAAASSVGVTSLPELIALAKKRPKGLNIAVLNRGGLPHLTAEWLRTASGTDITSVHYPAAPQALNDAIAGRVEAIVESLPALAGSVIGGSLKLLAVASSERLPDFSGVTTAAETFPGFQAVGWFALMAPPGTPEPIARKVSDDLRAVLARPELQQRYRDLATYARPMTPTELLAFARDEQQRWKPVIARIGIVAPK
jgi:tripartite-type tricarboxylate transporter receptor subunit TctC